MKEYPTFHVNQSDNTSGPLSSELGRDGGGSEVQTTKDSYLIMFLCTGDKRLEIQNDCYPNVIVSKIVSTHTISLTKMESQLHLHRNPQITCIILIWNVDHPPKENNQLKTNMLI